MKKNINFISFAFAFALVYRTQSGWSNHWNLQRARDCNCLSIEYSFIESIKGFAVNIPLDYFAIDIGNGNDNDENDDAIGRTVLFIYMIWFTYHLYYSSISFHFQFPLAIYQVLNWWNAMDGVYRDEGDEGFDQA